MSHVLVEIVTNTVTAILRRLVVAVTALSQQGSKSYEFSYQERTPPGLWRGFHRLVSIPNYYCYSIFAIPALRQYVHCRLFTLLLGLKVPSGRLALTMQPHPIDTQPHLPTLYLLANGRPRDARRASEKAQTYRST